MYDLSRGLELQEYTNEANWAQDGQVLMQPVSHFNFFVRSLLQLCSYLVQQLPTKYKILIDPNVFMSAFSMVNDEGERINASSWQGAPDGSAYDTHIEVSPDETIESPPGGDNDNSQDMQSATANPNDGEPLTGNTQVVIPTELRNLIVVRRQLALQWIDHQENRYRFLPIPTHKSPEWDFLRNKIRIGPHGARRIKAAKRKGQDGRLCLSLIVK
jgi:hypothetical protein